jgi:twitching motility protein PilT
MLSMKELIEALLQRGGSDLHIAAGAPPKIRIHGKLQNTEYEPLTPDDTKSLIYSILTSEQIAKFEKELELDFSFGLQQLGRFRTNVFVQRGAIGAVLRVIPYEVKSFEDLGLPRKLCESLCSLPKGLILVTGATGSGKSTSLAAMIDYINSVRSCHIVTIEDPIEFLHPNRNCLVTQREVGADTHKFTSALRSVLRQDPDVIMIGEMRDLETIEAALTLSETGHLTFATLHTSDAVQTINRIVDVFPDYQQQQIRTMLSFTLAAVFCQQLVPAANAKGRVLSSEVLMANPAVRSLIRDDKSHQIYSIIQTHQKYGMTTMNMSLANLYNSNQVTYEDVMSYTTEPEELERMLTHRQ